MIRRPSNLSFLGIAIVMMLVSVLLTSWLSTQFRWLDHPLGPRLRLILADNAGFGCSPDNTLLYTRGGGNVNAWDLRTARLRFQVADGISIAMDHGSRRLAIQNEKEIGIFDARVGEHLKALPLPDSSLRRRRFSPNGTLLCIETNDNHLAFWHLDRGEKIGDIEARLDNLAISPDDGRIAAWEGQDDKVIVRLWQTIEGSPIALLAEHRMPGQSAAISPDAATFATVNESVADRTEVALWETASAKKVDSILVGEALGKAHFFAPGGYLFVDSLFTKKGILFRLSPRLVFLGKFESRPIVSPDGRLLASALGDHGVTLFKTSYMIKLGNLANSSDDIPRIFIIGFNLNNKVSANFSSDGRWLAVHIPGSKARGMTWPSMTSNSIQIDRLVRIWDTETRREVRSFTDCHSIRFSPDSRSMIVSLLGDRVEVYDLQLSKTPFRIVLCSFFIWLLLMTPVGFAHWLLRRRGAG